MPSLARQVLNRILISLALLLSLGCGEKSVDAAVSLNDAGDSSRPENIDWFNGSIEQAFAQAKRENKPLFLYWGAVWCPPCHELKETIFKEQAFIDQSRLFVPVYLDGDTEQAQFYGDKFSVFGYPTVIVFSPDAREITRIPGGMDIQRYVSVLELALNAIRPVADLVRSVQQGQTLADADWNLLAYYSWSQDRGQVMDKSIDDSEKQRLFHLLADACPDALTIAKSRLQMIAATMWAELETPDMIYQASYLSQLKAVLADDQLSAANLESIIYDGASLTAALLEPSQRAAVREQFNNKILATIDNAELTLPVRLRAISGWVELQKSALDKDAQLSDSQQQWVSEKVAWGEAAVNDYQRHSAINTLWQTLYAAGLNDSARSMLLDALTVSKQPYYFMSDLGYLEKQLGNNNQAVDWYKRAWESSKGPATRIQWGVNYVVNAIELTPDDVVAIGASSEAIITELSQQSDGFYQRTSMRMNSLSSKLMAWSTETHHSDRQVIIDNLRQQIEQLCATFEGRSKLSCQRFLVQEMT